MTLCYCYALFSFQSRPKCLCWNVKMTTVSRQRVKCFTSDGMHRHTILWNIFTWPEDDLPAESQKIIRVMFSQRVNTGSKHVTLIITWTAGSRPLVGIFAVDEDNLFQTTSSSADYRVGPTSIWPEGGTTPSSSIPGGNSSSPWYTDTADHYSILLRTVLGCYK